MRREDLRLHAADREHAPAEGGLTRHRRVGTHAAAREQRDESGEDGDAGAGAVLGDGAGGHMDVDVLTLDHAGLDAEPFGVAPHVRERSARRLLHHVPELARDLDVALAGHARGLDEENGSAEWRPREAGGDTGDRGAFGDLALELRFAEMTNEIRLLDRYRRRGVDDDVVGLRFGPGVLRFVRVLARSTSDVEGGRAAKLLDLAIQLPDASLTGVVAHDRREGVVGDGELALLDAVLARSLGDEVAPRDVDLLVGRVAGQLDDLESIAERSRQRLERVRRAHEHDLGEVERQLEVVIGERLVLFGIEDLEQRGLG